MLVAGATAAAEMQPVPSELVGLWRVQDGACSGCDPSQGAETGAELRIAAGSYQNPFGSDCTQGAQVQAAPAEVLAAAQERLGLPPRWLSGAGQAREASVRVYRLVCAGKARETVLLLPGGTLLLPQEASTVLRLTRQH